MRPLRQRIWLAGPGDRWRVAGITGKNGGPFSMKQDFLLTWVSLNFRIARKSLHLILFATQIGFDAIGSEANHEGTTFNRLEAKTHSLRLPGQ
jgi:hypothetical protein